MSQIRRILLVRTWVFETVTQNHVFKTPDLAAVKANHEKLMSVPISPRHFRNCLKMNGRSRGREDLERELILETLNF